jgi:secreted trypsin-like serine protease
MGEKMLVRKKYFDKMILLNSFFCYLSGRGDSGGPLMLYTNNRWYTVGIVSFGDGCSRANSGGIYTRVSAYHKWIGQIMSSSTGPLNCSSAYDYTQIVTDVSTLK